jgi:hypothetical protein
MMMDNKQMDKIKGGGKHVSLSMKKKHQMCNGHKMELHSEIE